MADSSQKPIPRDIEATLSRLRRRIRLYVCLEGLALGVIWLGLMFWVGFAIDYLPVQFGFSELSMTARVGMLVAIGLVFAAILYWWVFRRVFVRMASRSMAILLERSNQQFHESLVTSVELSEEPEHAEAFNRAMLEHTSEDARRMIHSARLSGVFNVRPLLRNLSIAAVFVFSIVLFAVLSTDAFALWTRRLVTLSEENWQRRAYLEVLDFESGIHKVGKGQNLTLRVRADTERESVPEQCYVYWQSGGEGGTTTMKKLGQPVEVVGQDGRSQSWQYYRTSERPFREIMEDITFDVRGDDFRVAGLKVEVVETPVITETAWWPEFPQYLLDKDGRFPWGEENRFPEGTDLRLAIWTNKPPASVVLTDPAFDEDPVEIAFNEDGLPVELKYQSGDRSEWSEEEPALVVPLGVLTIQRDDKGNVQRGTVEREVQIIDRDGIRSRVRSFTVRIVSDKPPVVAAMKLRGIGTAITPQALLQFDAVISDDHAVDRRWINVDSYKVTEQGAVVERSTRQFDFQPPKVGPGEKSPAARPPTAVLDLRDESDRPQQPYRLSPGQRIDISLRASDRYDLTDEQNVGASSEKTLEVVTRDELLLILDVRQVALRRQFQAGALKPMEFIRDTLGQVRAGEDAENESLTLARVEGAASVSSDVLKELIALGDTFAAILVELQLNRVDRIEDRKAKLSSDVIRPIRRLSGELLPDFRNTVDRLQQNLSSEEEKNRIADDALMQADRIIAEMKEILRTLEDMEGQNQLVAAFQRLKKAVDGQIEGIKKLRGSDLDDLGGDLD